MMPAPSTREDLNTSGTEGSPLFAGRYEIKALLGEGAYGTVYRATDTALGEDVALKVLRRDMIDAPGVIDRFRNEVRLARRVTHPNVARVFDIGECQGERFLTMEFVDGTTLSRVVGREVPATHRVPLPRAIELLLPVCAGLAAAHAAGVIHRDLKPDNILVSESGRVVITDFGIAGGLRSEQEGQAPRAPIGTPAYMSPEQVEARVACDGRSDLYQLGVVLFELLTGELPFQGSTTVGVLMARMLKPPPDPRGVNPELPEPVARIVLRLLSQNREDRYRSADEVAAALRALLALPTGVGAPAAPLGADEPTRFLVADPASPRRPVVAQRAAVALSPEPAPMLRKAVAVLPFTSQSAPPDEALLLDGLTDALIDALSGLERVRVLSRGAVTQPQLAELSPRAAGERLGAESVVHGSVRRVGDELIVSVRLISVKDGIQVMARRYQRPAARIYSVADEAAQALAQALAAPEQAVSVGPLQDPRIAELYVRARQSYHRSGLLDTRQSCVLFEQALALSPHDPMLLSYCALAQARLWFFGGAGAGERAVQAAELAVRLAPQRGEPFLALAVVRFQSLDSVGAIAAVREALARMPSLVDGYDIAGHILMEAGPLRSGLQYLEYALGLDPSLQRARIDMARAYALRGDWDQAEQQLARAEAAGGSTAMWVLRARLTWWRHDRAAASSLLQRLNMPAELPLARRILEVALSGRSLGTMDELFGGVMSSSATSPRSRIYRLQLTAEMFAYCGAREEALRTVEQAVVEAQLFDLMWLERCPLFAPLRKTPRWPALRTQVEQRAASVHRALGWPTASTHPTARGG